jgi:predicted N-acetyltransferase YhbS
MVELPFEQRQLLIGEPEARQVRDVLDVRAGQGGHGLDDSGRGRYDRRMQLPRIRALTPADVDAASDALLRNDWGDRRANFRFAADHAESHAFVADADGEIVGTGIATVNGVVGWIGTIWVDPEWRRRGLGMALTQATIDAAEAAGCRTLVLVATDAGRPMYERIGFEVHTTYRILEAPGLGGGRPDPRIRAFRREDLARLVALDREATGEDRAHLLRAFAAPGTSRCVIRANGAIGGFVVRAPWGGGATIAPDPVDAATILRARRVAAGPEKRVRAGLLAENADGIAMLLADGWTEAWDGPRLVRGKPLDWHPESIWGQFNHAMG